MDAVLRRALRRIAGLRHHVDQCLLGDDGGTWEAELKKFLRRESCWTKGAEPNLRYDWRKDGLELVEHKPRTITAVSDFEPVPFLRDGEQTVCGYDLIGRARYELDANLGQEDAEFTLERPEEIPVELRPFYLPFTATIWRSPGGDLLVSCLVFAGGRWDLRRSWLEDVYGSRDRLLRLRRK